MAEKYQIVRFYKGQGHRSVIRKDVSLEEAQRHCKDPETSSSTCTGPVARDHTNRYGDWFDGYEEMK